MLINIENRTFLTNLDFEHVNNKTLFLIDFINWILLT